MPASRKKVVRTAAKDTTDSTKYSVPVVKSTFRILEALSVSGAMNLNELTIKTKIPKSTVFRVLATLVTMGYVFRDQERVYMLSRKLGDLVHESTWMETLRRYALPLMSKLRDSFGETVNLGILQFNQVVYLEVVPSEFALRLHERPGAKIHAHASAMGKSILAFSPPELLDSIANNQMEKLTSNTITTIKELRSEIQKVQKKGISFDQEETSSFATCIGVPILDEKGCAVAALSISGPSSRFQPKNDSPVVRSLQKVAEEISRQIRH